MAVIEDVIGYLPNSWVSRARTYAIGYERGMVRKTKETGLMTIYIFAIGPFLVVEEALRCVSAWFHSKRTSIQLLRAEYYAKNFHCIVPH